MKLLDELRKRWRANPRWAAYAEYTLSGLAGATLLGLVCFWTGYPQAAVALAFPLVAWMNLVGVVATLSWLRSARLDESATVAPRPTSPEQTPGMNGHVERPVVNETGGAS